MKILLPIVMVFLLVFAWFSFFSGHASEVSAYEACIRNAEESVNDRLYEQAIEYYKESLKYENSEQTYLLIKEVYDTLYAEEHTSFFRGCYIEDMAAAAQAYPQNETFWLMQVELYMEQGSHKQAFQVLKDAMNKDVQSEKLSELYLQLLYMVDTDYKMYYDFKTALNGYISVFDGAAWTVLDSTGEQVRSSYNFIGLLNDDGKGIYTNSIDTRLLDGMEVTRARFSVNVEEAGYYNENVDLVPVKIDGSWKYMNSLGEFLPGEYEIAGSFYGEQAAAKSANGWVLISTDGSVTKLAGFEDIKLDLYGCHIQNNIVIAKKSGKYHLYDTNFEQIGDFSADDMDICIDPGKIAFQSGGKWGFVDSVGNVVLEPTYAGAKSYANGYAAVCNSEGLWGFIGRDFTLLIDYAYLDAHYFTGAETCLVSEEEGTVQILSFVFE